MNYTQNMDSFWSAATRKLIDSILADIRESQKEVNGLSQTLQRSFSAADEVIFRDVERTKSNAAKQCYKSLARMHEAFANLVEHVQASAALPPARASPAPRDPSAPRACTCALSRRWRARDSQTIANSATTTVDLNTKVAELTARNTPEAIERVTADLKVIRAENAKLVAPSG